jgi:D-glycero-alpha-D-manno-heptose-7-phosphate kinase
MIITRTPFRMSFFGGGSDYPAYFQRHGGATLATAIDKYVYVTVQPLSDCFDHRLQVHYSRVEAVKTLEELHIPNVREALRLLGIEHGVEIHLVSDLPARTGLGTSSATTVGLLKALHAHRGELVSEAELAREAVHVEQEMIREQVGNQDQYITAFGGFRHLRFLPDKILADPVPLAQARIKQLRERLIMFYTGLQRMAGEVVTEQLERTSNGDLDGSLGLMKDQVMDGVDILTGSRPLAEFGELLHQAWQLKRGLSSRVSTPWVDEAYARARVAGALGGKLLGAGSGGFMLLYAEPERRTRVRQALSHMREVPFDFEPEGTRLIYYLP